jgi:hypothetical protein
MKFSPLFFNKISYANSAEDIPLFIALTSRD